MIGGALGIAVAILDFVLALGSSGDISMYLYLSGIGAIIFSLTGIAGSTMSKRKLLGGIVMILSAFGVFLFIFLFGIPSALVFLAGGAMLIKEHLDEGKAKPATPAPPPDGGRKPD